MNKMNFKFELNEIPPWKELILLGIQWLVITIPTIIIIGKVIAEIHFNDPLEQTLYFQKLIFVTAVTLLAQLYWGHGLPIIVGPASVLLVGIVASQGSSIDSIYSSIIIGGMVLLVLSMTGLFAHLKALFTPRVVATTLILIAFTLTPMILNLITTSNTAEATGFKNIVFALIFIYGMFITNRFLKGIWKSTLIIWAILFGSIFYNFLFPPIEGKSISYAYISSFFTDFTRFSFDLGVTISFLICFLALVINDLGSIEAVSEMIKPDKREKRITSGITITGLGNILSGFFGVIGTVNFSLSPGVIASTRCASKYTLVPMGIGLIILSFLPQAIAFLGSIPSVVTGSVLVYIMCSQIAAGLVIAFNSMEKFVFENGLVIGLALMLSVIISFLPAEVLNTFPAILRPILGNGFVVGVLSVLIMDHLIMK